MKQAKSWVVMDALIYLLVIWSYKQVAPLLPPRPLPSMFPFPSVGVTMPTDGPKFLDGDGVVRI